MRSEENLPSPDGLFIATSLSLLDIGGKKGALTTGNSLSYLESALISRVIATAAGFEADAALFFANPALVELKLNCSPLRLLWLMFCCFDRKTLAYD